MPNPDLVYDVGLHNGDDSAYYLALGYRVIAIEADPTLVERARERLKVPIVQDQLQIGNVGIADREGTLPFWICEGKTEWSSFDKASATRRGRRCHSVDVNCVPFAKILREFGVPHYLKIDIEGYDRSCLDGLDRNDLPNFISLELTDPGVFAHLRDIGYSRFKIIIQNNHAAIRRVTRHWTHALTRRLPLYWRSFRYRLGLPVATRSLRLPPDAPEYPGMKWKFPYGSSGPFGESTDGDWSTLEEITALYDEFRAGRLEYGDPGSLIWHDVHAKRG